MRTKKAMKNMIAAMIYQVVAIVCGPYNSKVDIG